MECQPSGWHGDNYCDDGVLNTENCKWDGGDCCGDNVNTNYCSVSFVINTQYAIASYLVYMLKLKYGWNFWFKIHLAYIIINTTKNLFEIPLLHCEHSKKLFSKFWKKYNQEIFLGLLMSWSWIFNNHYYNHHHRTTNDRLRIPSLGHRSMVRWREQQRWLQFWWWSLLLQWFPRMGLLLQSIIEF